MLSIAPLLAVVALVSLQCAVGTSSILENRRKLEMDNDLLSNRNLAKAEQNRRLRKYVHIVSAPPKTVHSQQGEAFVLTCEIYGSPSPTVAWLRNGQVLIDFEEEANEIFSSHPSSLGRLTAKLLVPVPRNGDVYTCLAASGAMEQSASTTILTDGEEKGKFLTLDRLFRVPANPLIMIHYNELFQTMGTSVTLPCRVQSMTKAQVYWTNSEDKLVFGDPRFRVLSSGDLMINNLQWSDMGTFKCIVKNAFGMDSAESFIYPTKP